MATDVIMPQMGESIAEGTITSWLKKVGDTVNRDEPLFEISTDKVDAEIPSPAAGVLLEVKAQAGETVAVNSIVAVIGESGEKPAGDAKTEAKADAPKAEAPKAEVPKAEAPKAEAPKAEPAKQAPKAEAPKTEAPKADGPAPQVEAPKAVARKPAPPKSEPPVDEKK